MSSHKASTIDEFRIQFNLPSDRKDNVDNWVRSAMEKRVKRFQLDIQPIRCWSDERLYYTFPNLSFNSLTSLQLTYLDVPSKVLEKLLHDCPLEYLSLCWSFILGNFKVVGPSLKLKCLRLMKCYWPVDDFKISAPNLTSFDYCGKILDSPFKSIPKLTEFSIGGDYCAHLLYDFSSLLSYASQIQVLTLEVNYDITRDERIRIAEAFPDFTRLKMLNIIITPKFDYQLFGLFSLIKACPLLHKFVLEFRVLTKEVKRTAETRNVEACPHHCLKIIEIEGFAGWEIDFGFVECLIENAVSLEKIIIEPTQYPTDYETCLEERQKRAIQRAEQLRGSLKPGIEMQMRNDPLPPTWLSY